MERKFLEDLGLEKEAIEKIMAENGKDIKKHKDDAEAAEKDRDAFKAQVDDVAAKLKTFEGVDVEKLNAEINTLKEDLAAKETEFQSQIAERDFQTVISAEIAAAKGKNSKAIMALLDIDALKGSKNQKEDAAAAIKGLAETDAYLFEGTEGTKGTPASVSTGGKHNETNDIDADSFTAAAMKGAGLETGKD